MQIVIDIPDILATELQPLVDTARVASLEALIKGVIMAELKPKMIAMAQETMGRSEAQTKVNEKLLQIKVTAR